MRNNTGVDFGFSFVCMGDASGAVSFSGVGVGFENICQVTAYNDAQLEECIDVAFKMAANRAKAKFKNERGMK